MCFRNIRHHFIDYKWFYERAILAPKSNRVNVINLQAQQQLLGEDNSYKSIDTVVDDNEVVQNPTGLLSSLEPPGMPPYSYRVTQKFCAP